MNFEEEGDDCLEYCQCGNGLAGFEGVRYQKGFGLFGSLFAKVLPYLKQFGKYIGKKLLGIGADVASDVVEGKPIKESVKQRVKSSAKLIAEDGMTKLQELLQKGNGRRKALAKTKIKKVKRKQTKTCRRMKVKKSNKRRKTTRRKTKTSTLSFLA